MDVQAIDLSSQDYHRNPLPTFKKMREQGPLLRVKMPFVGEVWTTSTYEAAVKVLRDKEAFVTEPRNAGRRGRVGIKWWMPGIIRNLTNNMLGKDDPDHRRLRELVESAFMRQSIDAPRPRIARRVIKNGSGIFAGENWIFMAGEFGGGTWAIERESGREDEVTLRDFRLVLGFESKSKTGPNWLIETGYVFGREIEYESSTPNIDPGDTVLFRSGLTF